MSMKETVDFCERLRTAAANRADVTLFGVDYTPLPLDADGVPIRVGDVMEKDSTGNSYGVFAIELRDKGWRVMLCDDHRPWQPKFLTHHHAPTVEDVLREFANDIADVLGGDDFKLDGNDELFAEYAAKLRLAGDDE